ncbi:LOW QUALITY PROTEIN: hypothetical protein RTBOTA2_001371 [Rhodotorula toruloides]|nr:LOW QUALITY PROTEIN: hypothetical protein RTBOTA2_001371 [Rhodotorula toruloides]
MAPPHEAARSLVSSLATEIPTHLNFSSHVASLHPRYIDISSTKPAVLKAILDSTRTYQILAIWSPDLTAVVLCYLFAAMLKGSTELLVRGEAVERAWASVRGKKGTEGIEVADAQARLSVPAKAATVLALQLYAWRLFVVPQTPIRIDDVEVLMVALKLLLVGYAADLIFSAFSIEIFLHHLFTFALLVVGQIAAYKTSELKFCRLAQWLILQATLEQAEYLALGCYHLSKYFSMQERPETARKMLRVAYRAMRVSSYVCWVQKFLPVGFAIYWLKRLWAEVDYLPWGRAWCGMATAVLSLLLILQVRFCDDQSSLAAHFRHKLEGGPPPPRNGPVMRFLLRLFRSRPRRASSSPLPQHAEECTQLDKAQKPVCETGRD